MARGQPVGVRSRHREGGGAPKGARGIKSVYVRGITPSAAPSIHPERTYLAQQKTTIRGRDQRALCPPKGAVWGLLEVWPENNKCHF